MKKPIIVAVIVIAVLLLTYFAMWFFLCQTFAIKMNALLTPIYKTVGTENGSQFLKDLNSSKAAFLSKHDGEDQDEFVKSIRSAYNKYSGQWDEAADFNNIKTKVIQLNFLGDMINIALGRAIYSDRSVPLGAIREPLEVYCATYRKIEVAFETETNSDLIAKPMKNYREYQYILIGKEAVLLAYLKSGMKKRTLIALEQIDRDKIKKMRDSVVDVFTKSSDLEVRFASIKTYFSLSQPKNEAMNKFLMDILAQPEVPVAAIELAGQTYNRDFMPFLTVLTNGLIKADVRDAALTAVSRMRAK